MKQRRITRQVIIKTSVASVLVAVFTFLLAYSTVLFLATPLEEGARGGALEGGPELTHRRVRLLWSEHGRSKFHSRYGNGGSGNGGQGFGVGLGQKGSPSPYWGYRELVGNITHKPICPKDPLIIILITSAPKNTVQRNTIRNTWCSQSHFMKNNKNAMPWKCIFLLGETRDAAQNKIIRQEAHAHHGDMLIGSFSDSYRNLTYKVLTGFHWTVYECKPKFVLKTDDDCFVNVNILVPFLQYYFTQESQHQEDPSLLYVGNVFQETKALEVIRHSESKWAVSREEYAPDLYPQYASGSGYIVALPVAGRLLQVARTYRPFPNEDAYMGVLAESVGVTPLHSHRFTFVSSQWTLCNFLYLLVIHRVSLEEQRNYFSMANQAGEKCSDQPFYKTWN